MSGNSTLRKQLNELYEPRFKLTLDTLGKKRLELMEQARVATPGSDKQKVLFNRATEIWKCMQAANLASANLIEKPVNALGDAWAELGTWLGAQQTRLMAPPAPAPIAALASESVIAKTLAPATPKSSPFAPPSPVSSQGQLAGANVTRSAPAA